MNDDPVFDALRHSIVTVMNDIPAEAITVGARLRDLGANSVDRAEILTLTMQKLRLRVPLLEFARAENIGGLVELMRAKVPARDS
jgi:polyketide biosynthesis acyl carrier protein